MSWQAAALDLALRVVCKSRLQNLPLTEAGQRLDRLLHRASQLLSLPASVERQSVLVGGVPCEWVVAEDARGSTGAVVYFHGGAFTAGSPRSHLDVAWRLSAACSRRVLLVDYRLSPDHAFPAALEDAVAVYRALRDAAGESAPLAFAGDSAGANLALATISSLLRSQQTLPDACICLSPWVDLTHGGHGIGQQASREAMLPLDLLEQAARAYAGARPLDDAAVSPLYADFSGFPPLLIYASEHELLLDDARRLASRAEAAGVSVKLCVWPKQAHAFPTTAAFVPEARVAIAEIGRFASRKQGASALRGEDPFAELHFEHTEKIERVPATT